MTTASHPRTPCFQLDKPLSNDGSCLTETRFQLDALKVRPKPCLTKAIREHPIYKGVREREQLVRQLDNKLENHARSESSCPIKVVHANNLSNRLTNSPTGRITGLESTPETGAETIGHRPGIDESTNQRRKAIIRCSIGPYAGPLPHLRFDTPRDAIRS